MLSEDDEEQFDGEEEDSENFEEYDQEDESEESAESDDSAPEFYQIKDLLKHNATAI